MLREVDSYRVVDPLFYPQAKQETCWLNTAESYSVRVSLQYCLVFADDGFNEKMMTDERVMVG